MFGKIFDRSTPGQLYHIGDAGVTCELIESDSALQPHIHYYWLLNIVNAKIDLEVIPDAALDLVLSPSLPEFSCLYLPTTEKFNIPLQGPITYVGICFHPQSALHFFDTSFARLAGLEPGCDTTTALQITSLVDAIQTLSTLNRLKVELDRYFINALSALAQSKTPTNQIPFNVLLDQLTPASVKEIAHRTGMSERQFRRTTANLTGLSPKQLQRVMRLQSTLHALFDQHSKPEQDAFYDDSHKIREIKQLTGLTPGQIRKLAEKYNS